MTSQRSYLNQDRVKSVKRNEPAHRALPIQTGWCSSQRKLHGDRRTLFLRALEPDVASEGACHEPGGVGPDAGDTPLRIQPVDNVGRYLQDGGQFLL